MTDERRYTEQEIAAIFERAAEAQAEAQQALDRRDGLTMEELQRVGRAAGFTPESIARAAAAVDRPAPPPVTRMGVPVGVSRTVELPGPMDDEAWEGLVADLRDTFDATGTVRGEGGLRQWRNGNLHALVERTPDGHRLRMRTRNASLSSGLAGGGLAFVVGLLLVLMLALDGRIAIMQDDTFISMLFVLIGGAVAGSSAFRLRRWADLRGRQMDAVGRRALERTAAGAPALHSAGKAPLTGRMDAPDGYRSNDAERAPERRMHGR